MQHCIDDFFLPTGASSSPCFASSFVSISCSLGAFSRSEQNLAGRRIYVDARVAQFSFASAACCLRRLRRHLDLLGTLAVAHRHLSCRWPRGDHLQLDELFQGILGGVPSKSGAGLDRSRGCRAELVEEGIDRGRVGAGDVELAAGECSCGGHPARFLHHSEVMPLMAGAARVEEVMALARRASPGRR